MPSPATAYSWVKQIPRSLFLLDKIPLIGDIPPIPLAAWAENLKDSLGLDTMQIQTKVLNWTEEKDFFNDIPNKKVFGFSIPGIVGVFFLALPSNVIADLAAKLLIGSDKTGRDIDPQVEEGFIRFIINEALFTLQKSGQPENMMPVFLETLPPLPHDAGLVLDVSLQINEKTVPCRLIVSKEFQTSLAQEFTPNLHDRYLKSPLSEAIDMTISFEASRFKINLKEFNSLKCGDFIVLKHCSIDPNTKSGPILLKVFNLPFFSGQLSDGKVTLAEISQYYEAEAQMQSDNPDKDEDFDLEGEELEEFEEEDLQEFSDEELEELDEDKEITSHEIEDIEEEEFAEGVMEPPQKAPHITEEETPLEQKEEPISSSPLDTPKTSKELFQAGDVPLSLSVEIGRINISLNKLMELASGNILEINTPEEGVDLIFNGKKVAQGELLKIGEVLGIRITDIGQ